MSGQQLVAVFLCFVGLATVSAVGCFTVWWIAERFREKDWEKPDDGFQKKAEEGPRVYQNNMHKRSFGPYDEDVRPMIWHDLQRCGEGEESQRVYWKYSRGYGGEWKTVRVLRRCLSADLGVE